jgi:hypothetical protein
MTDLTSEKIPTAALGLGVAGLVPFLAGAVSSWFGLPFAVQTGWMIGIYYGAVILSFLGGVRWGLAIGPYQARRQDGEFVLGVGGSLAGFAAVFLQPIAALTLLLAGFLMQALWDVTSVESGRLPSWYGKLRMMLTAGAVVCLVAVLASAALT